MSLVNEMEKNFGYLSSSQAYQKVKELLFVADKDSLKYSKATQIQFFTLLQIEKTAMQESIFFQFVSYWCFYPIIVGRLTDCGGHVFACRVIVLQFVFDDKAYTYEIHMQHTHRLLVVFFLFHLICSYLCSLYLGTWPLVISQAEPIYVLSNWQCQMVRISCRVVAAWALCQASKAVIGDT